MAEGEPTDEKLPYQDLKAQEVSWNSCKTLSLVERFEIVRSVGVECFNEEELRILLANKPRPVCYDRVDPTARLRIDQAVLKTLNVNKLISAGCKVKIWIADYFAQMKNPKEANSEKLKAVGDYLIEVWTALGMSLDGVEFVWSSAQINKRADEYWPLVLDICRKNMVTDILRILSVGTSEQDDNRTQIMEQSEQDQLAAAELFYPCMECADIFFSEADICELGMDQHRVYVLATEYCDAIKSKNKSIMLSNYILPELQQGQKMSKSDLSSCIFMDDKEAEVNTKIKKAFCPPKVVVGNPCLEYVKHIIFPWFMRFDIARREENGGNKTFKTFEELVTDYERDEINPGDLKAALSKALNKILQSVRDHFRDNPKGKNLLERIKCHKVTK